MVFSQNEQNMSQAKIDIVYLNKLCKKISHGKNVDSNFEIFYEKTKESLQTFVYYMLNRHNQDILQETYHSFFLKLESGFVPENPLTYLKSIARNLIYNEIRNSKLHKSYDNLEIVYNDKNIEENELMELIQIAVSSLDEKYREVFVLKEFQGLSHTEIAAICDISVDNSRKRLTRAYKKINQILAPYIKEIKELS
jgi:RNA polymerase sigma-70 factor (ECF subfamily)